MGAFRGARPRPTEIPWRPLGGCDWRQVDNAEDDYDDPNFVSTFARPAETKDYYQGVFLPVPFDKRSRMTKSLTTFLFGLDVNPEIR